MTHTSLFKAGAYRFIPSVFQYSGGVVAEPGHRIERVTFRRPVPLVDGFRRAAEIIRDAGRPLTAFCACELRSPAPFSEAGFRSFNESYVDTLKNWGLFEGGLNPVARSNVCPEISPPPEPSFHAFAFTTVSPGAPPSFCVAGSGEAPEGRGNYRDHIVALGDVSSSGMARKADWVLGEMQRRLASLGFAWSDTTATQVYTVHDLRLSLVRDIVGRGAALHGLTWQLCRPPIVDIEFEMDCRGVAVEHML